MRSLVPKKKREENWTPAAWSDHPFAALHRQVDDLFNEFFESFPGFRRSGWPEGGLREAGVPQVEVSETDRAVKVKVELPGMDDKDIEVLLDDNVLTIRGEKREERTEEQEDYHVSEVRYGHFSRSIPVPPGVDREAVTSSFKKGVLRLTLPKSKAAAENRRRIEITTED